MEARNSSQGKAKKYALRLYREIMESDIPEENKRAVTNYRTRLGNGTSHNNNVMSWHTQKGRLETLKRFLFAVRKPLSKVTRQDIDNYFFEMASQQNGNGKPFKKNTVANHRLGVIQLLKFVGRGEVVEGMRPGFDDGKVEMEDLPDEREVKKLINACRKLSHKAIVAVVMECGLRRGEIFSLKLSDCSFLPNGAVRIKVRSSKTRPRVVLAVKSALLLREYVNKEHPDPQNSDAHLWVYCTTPQNPRHDPKRPYRPIDYYAGSKLMREACMRAGIVEKPVSFHKLRHYAITHSDLNEMEKRIYFWGNKKTKQIERYWHTDQDTIEKKLQAKEGLEVEQETDPMKMQTCPACGVRNSFDRVSCITCGSVLSLEQAKESKQLRDVIVSKVLAENPALRELLNKATKDMAERLAEEGAIRR